MERLNVLALKDGECGGYPIQELSLETHLLLLNSVFSQMSENLNLYIVS